MMYEINRIKEVLKEKGKTQVWLGKEIGKSRVAVTNYVNNVHQPALETLRDIASALGVDIRELLFPTRYFDREPAENAKYIAVDAVQYDKLMAMIDRYRRGLKNIRKAVDDV